MIDENEVSKVRSESYSKGYPQKKKVFELFNFRVRGWLGLSSKK